MENEELLARILVLEAFVRAVRNVAPSAMAEVSREFDGLLAVMKEDLAKNGHSQHLQQFFSKSVAAVQETSGQMKGTLD